MGNKTNPSPQGEEMDNWGTKNEVKTEEEKFVLGNKTAHDMVCMTVSASSMGPNTMELVVKRLQELLHIKMMEVMIYGTFKILLLTFATPLPSKIVYNEHEFVGEYNGENFGTEGRRRKGTWKSQGKNCGI